MAEDWQLHISRIEQLAREKGLNYHRVEFEVVPESFMTEIAIYGLPVRMPHWSFGVRYIYQLIQHRMGLSRLFEVVFPGNPGRAYLAKSNSAAENVLVTAHVLGHADFSANNMLFRRSQDQVGEHIVEQAAAHARQIGMAIEEHGLERVESVLVPDDDEKPGVPDAVQPAGRRARGVHHRDDRATRRVEPVRARAPGRARPGPPRGGRGARPDRVHRAHARAGA